MSIDDQLEWYMTPPEPCIKCRYNEAKCFPWQLCEKCFDIFVKQNNPDNNYELKEEIKDVESTSKRNT